MSNDSIMNHTRSRQVEMNNVQNQISSQNRLQRLRDDPAAASHATRYQSYLARLDRYSENLEYGINNYRVTEGHMRQAVDIMQEIRSIAIQGANGTYSQEDTRHMARHVDELLGALIETANAKNAEGVSVFAGDRSRSTPFKAIEGNIPAYGGRVITEVSYQGSIGIKQTEISDGNYMDMNFPGNRVFWAENQAIYSGRDTSDYVLSEDAIISLDAVEIPLRQGDNVYSIMSAINRSEAAVKARLDPVTNALVLETTSPHQIWLKDESGQVLSDLGILKDDETPPPGNLNPAAKVFGGSLFDSVIRLRNELFAGDQIDIGGAALGGIDQAMNNLLSELGSLGAKTERMEFTYQRVSQEIPDTTRWYSAAVDVDMTEMITRLKTLETVHQAALATLARVAPQSLLNFLR